MKLSKGFTLVELLTVVALCGLLATFLVSSAIGVYKDYNNQLVIEKAYTDLYNLELLRRSSSRSSSFNSLDADGFSLVVDEYGAENEFVFLMNRFEGANNIQPIDSENLRYSMSRRVASISFRVSEERDLAYTNIPEVNPVDEATNLYPGAKTIFTDGAQSFLDITIYHREKDPLIANYVLDALPQR